MDKNLFKPLMTIGSEYGPDEKTIVKYRVEFIPQADGSVEIGDDTWDYKTKEYLTGNQGRYSREDAIKKWNELYNNPSFVIDNSTTVDESTNKYIKAFRESCRKLEEDNGNPSIPQAIDYDINNVEFEEDPYNKDVVDGIKALYDAADTFVSQMYYMSSRHKIKGPQKNKVVAELRTLARQIANKAYQALQLATKSSDETKYTKPEFYHKPSDLRSFFNPYEYERANGKHVDIANSDYTGDKI